MKKVLLLSLLLTFILSSMSFAGKSVKLVDVTKQWTYDYDVVTAFPQLRKLMPTGEDNDWYTHVFELRHIQHGNLRVEIFDTSGDCGHSTFAITDIPQYIFDKDGKIVTSRDGKRGEKYYKDDPRVYYLEKYSAWDTEECGKRPYQGKYVHQGRFPPEKMPSIKSFIEKKFINMTIRHVEKPFIPLCDGRERYISKPHRGCVDPKDLGDLGA